MTTQQKTVSKVCVIVLLVAAFLFTVFSGCFDSVAFAASSTVSYQWKMVDSSGNTIPNTSGSTSKPNEYGTAHLIMQARNWFTFDGWYFDEARTQKAPPLMDGGDKNVQLYGAYVLNFGPGDVNGDGKVTTADITRYCQYIVGGYGVKEVKKGQEWACAQDPTFTSSSNLFFECNASVYNNSKSNTLNLTYLRMAIADGYGLEVNNGEVTDYKTVYFYDHYAKWDAYVYIWSDEGIYTPSFPGSPMNSESSSLGNYWYSAQIPANLTNPKVIFSDKNTGAQTADLVFDEAQPYYANGIWNSSKPTVNQGQIRIYVFTGATSGIHNIHYWGGSSSTNWPGAKMQYDSSLRMWYKDIPSGSTGIIFNNKTSSTDSGNYQTNNIENFGYYWFFNYTGTSDGKWQFDWYNKINPRIYYYKPTAQAPVRAYVWNDSYISVNGSKVNINNTWPGELMTPVAGSPGWYEYETPIYMRSVQFNGGDDSTKWNDNLSINRGLPYYNSGYTAGWKNESGKDTTAYLLIDGVRYPMVNDNSTQDKITVNLYAGQKVQMIWRTGSSSVLQASSDNTKSTRFTLSNGVYTVSTTDTYTFYCQSGKVYVS